MSNSKDKNLKTTKKNFESGEDLKKEVKEAFDLFDSDKDQKLDFYEFKVALKALGIEKRKDQLLALLNGQKKIAYDDFERISIEAITKRDPLEEIKRAFRLFDDDGSGRITLRKLRRVARELGQSISDEELTSMIEQFDTNGDGEIDLEEFIGVMQYENSA